MSDELKPCPFCGGHPVMIAMDTSVMSTYQVACENGGCKVQPWVDCDDEAQATAAWNARANDWQPIETAPKDGQSVALFEPRRLEQFVGYWNASRTAFVPLTSMWETTPTHWKPLEPPPALSRESRVAEL